MFTGIVEAVAVIKQIKKTRGGAEVTVVAPRGWRLKKGASISVSGICSTVVKTGATLSFIYIPETVRRTNVQNWQKGDSVNLERSVTPNTPLDGHVVQGHVDTTGTIVGVATDGNARRVTIAPRDKKYLRYSAEKGSIAVDGVSLTVTVAGKNTLSVDLIPYTLVHTTFGEREKGDTVNIECDVLAKYAERLLSFR